MKVWVLTSCYNDYDQHGDYFEAVFKNKPSIEELSNRLELDIEFHLPTLEKLMNGGGRTGTEYKWYYLTEINLD